VSFLLDTNIVSEKFKGARCDVNVAAWFDGVASNDLFLSVLVLGEIRKGAEMIRARDLHRARKFEAWVLILPELYSSRVLPLTAEIADEWGRMSAFRALPVIDSLLAATAKVHGLTLVSRNRTDFAGLDVAVLDPFTA